MFLLLIVPKALFCKCEMNRCARTPQRNADSRSLRPTFLGGTYAHPPPPGWRSLTSAPELQIATFGANICTHSS